MLHFTLEAAKNRAKNRPICIRFDSKKARLLLLPSPDAGKMGRSGAENLGHVKCQIGVSGKK